MSERCVTDNEMLELLARGQSPGTLHRLMLKSLEPYRLRITSGTFVSSIDAAGRLAAYLGGGTPGIERVFFSDLTPEPTVGSVPCSDWDKEKTAVKLLAGPNMGDLWIRQVVMAHDRPLAGVELLRELDDHATWLDLQQAGNTAIKKLFKHDSEQFKIEKCVLQNLHDMLRAWIIGAWLGRENEVMRRSFIIELLGTGIVYGQHPRDPQKWVVLFA